jgi:hypothetical protein
MTRARKGSGAASTQLSGQGLPRGFGAGGSASGLGLEVITELVARYRFDLCDWLDIWVPRIE